VVEHLHGKQKVIGSIPILGRKSYKKETKKDTEPQGGVTWQKKRFSVINRTSISAPSATLTTEKQP
jgi:hypothetical protein